MKFNESEIPSPNDAPPAPAGESSDDSSAALVEAVDRCRRCPDLLAELTELCRQVDACVAETGVACLGGGACCRFDLASHRLYVSTAELAALTQQAPAVSPAEPGRCAYQLGPRCMARGRRPLGCRTYFCNYVNNQALQATYERFHRLLRRLHERLAVPYHYFELTAGLSLCLRPIRSPN